MNLMIFDDEVDDDNDDDNDGVDDDDRHPSMFPRAPARWSGPRCRSRAAPPWPSRRPPRPPARPRPRPRIGRRSSCQMRAATRRQPPLPPWRLFRQKFVWSLTLAKVFFDPVWYFYVFWFPQFLYLAVSPYDLVEIDFLALGGSEDGAGGIEVGKGAVN